jgi:hypothetical protein
LLLPPLFLLLPPLFLLLPLLTVKKEEEDFVCNDESIVTVVVAVLNDDARGVLAKVVNDAMSTL